MPIRPENRERYPSNWSTEIRPAVLARANNRCEKCKAPNGWTVCREMSGATYMIDEGYVFDSETGDCLGRARLYDYPAGRYVSIVLTIAHLDHTPENCDGMESGATEPKPIAESNLRAWCQRCHLRYDAGHHKETRAETRARNSKQPDMFRSAK
jgi:hypothetical protein